MSILCARTSISGSKSRDPYFAPPSLPPTCLSPLPPAYRAFPCPRPAVDLHQMSNCIAFAGGKYDILSGRDEVLLSALAMGAKGGVG